MIKNNISINEVVEGCNGDLVQAARGLFSGISTDSREEQENSIFLPLRGENHDAHDYIEEAIKNGARCIVSDKDISVPSNTALVKVQDSLIALQNLANYWRKKWAGPVLAITGTNGKTTTKEFLHQILEQDYNVCYSKGSFNNHWGLPLSLLHLKEDHDVMISEMGMSGVGEIARLCNIAEPSTVVVTNVGKGHLEGMKTLDNIAREKKQIYLKSPNARQVFNLDNPYTFEMFKELRKESDLSFSLKDSEADVFLFLNDSAKVCGHIGGEEGEANFSVFGKHNISNLATAITLAYSFGMPAKNIWRAIEKCQTTWGRNQWLDLDSGAKALFDAYNANPESMNAFLDNIKDLKVSGKKYLVIGDMRELGEQNEVEHKLLADKVYEQEWQKVYFIGENWELFKRVYKGENLIVSNTCKDSLANSLEPVLSKTDIVFLKASRGVHLEHFLQGLKPVNFVSK